MNEDTTIIDAEVVNSVETPEVSEAQVAATPDVTPEEAERIIKEDLEKKSRACAEEVNAVLARHGFDIVVGNVSIQIVPKQAK